jgi:hypothetical protein
MPNRSLRLLTLWASAFAGCGFFLLAGLPTGGPVSLALIGQLSWLALIGSVPTTLVLAAATRVASARLGIVILSIVAVAILAAAIGWEHTDFLLSGPRWAFHPRRPAVRGAMLVGFALAAAAGWCWLILGAGAKRALHLSIWVAVSLLVVVAISAAMVRYRAYDYTIAQLVFPAGALSSAIVYLLVRGSRRRTLLWAIAAVGLLFVGGSRLHPDFVSTGRREVIAESRAGALAMLYVLPHFGRDDKSSNGEASCPQPKPVLLDTPIDIPPEGRRNVIVVTVDALRADVVGMAVESRPVTPELSKLIEGGVSFENATSTYPATLFAIGSAFTGLSPAELYLFPSLPDTIFTRSRGVVDRQLAVLPDVSWFRLPIVERFLASGVKTIRAKPDANATTALIDQLDDARREGASVMAWIHYYAPHDPYRPQRGLDFGKGKRNAYLSEVAYFDRELGRLMGYLGREGWLDDTLVVFFSDHGEALGEKSYWGHHVYLNAWMIDVPLVLWHAALPASTPSVGVSLADVAPTVLHFLGIPMPGDLPAQSLFALSPDLRGRPTFSEAFPVRGRALFDGFQLPALDDATIVDRLRSIRTTSRGYEPKIAITGDDHRLIHHRGVDALLLYDRGETSRGDARSSTSLEARKLLEGQLSRWEREQQQRIRCRLQLSAESPAPPRRE